MKKFSRLVIYLLVLAWILVAQFEWTQKDVARKRIQAAAVSPELDSAPPGQPETGAEPK